MVWDMFSHVYGNENVTIENAKDISKQYCLSKTDGALYIINERAVYCHQEARVYESVASLKEGNAS